MVTKRHSKDKKAPEYLRSLCQTRIPWAKDENLPIEPYRLAELIEKASQNAYKNYRKLTRPKVCDLSTYINYWVQEAILSDLINKTTKKVCVGESSNSNDYLARAVAVYFSILPLNKLQKLKQKILSTLPYTKRKNTWKQFKLLVEQLEKPFIELAVARNKFAQSKRYRQYTELILAINQVSNSTYEGFSRNVDIVISHIHKQLPKLPHVPHWFYSPLNFPCFICQLPFPNLGIPDEVIDIAKKEYPILKDYQHKVSIYFGNKTQIKYHKEIDSFKIELPKNYNKSHQMIGLIHELGHTIAMLENFKKSKTPLETGRYKAEKSASEIELKLLENLSPVAFHARLGDILLIFHRVLFELAVYANPKQALPQLYAKIFNRCFPEADQQNNRLYLLDEDIILKPLSSLSQAIAYTELLFNKKNS